MSGPQDTFDPRFDPAFQPGFVGSPSQPTVPARQAPVDAAPPVVAAPQATEPTADIEDEPAAARQRPNPFLLALGALAVALVVAGVGILLNVQRSFGAGDNYIDFVIMELLIRSAPLSIALGVAIGAGILFLLAVSWGQRSKGHNS
jgi:hypothetical protein